VRLYPAQIGRYRLIDRAKNDWMEADVYVIGHPLHAVTDEQGHYRIEGVPVGKLKIAAQHPAIFTLPTRATWSRTSAPTSRSSRASSRTWT